MKGLMTIALIAIVFMFGCHKAENMMSPNQTSDTPQCQLKDEVEIVDPISSNPDTLVVSSPCGEDHNVGSEFWLIFDTLTDLPNGDRTVTVTFNPNELVLYLPFGYQHVSTLDAHTKQWQNTNNGQIILHFWPETPQPPNDTEHVIDILIEYSDGTVKSGEIQVEVLPQWP